MPNFNHKSFRPDTAHTYAIAGWGKDMAASSILILCHLGYFGRGGIDKKLGEGFSHFKAWCTKWCRTTSLTDFSLKTFKLGQTHSDGNWLFSYSYLYNLTLDPS